MIIERLTWHAKFGQGDRVIEAFKRWQELFGQSQGLKARILTDVTGTMFTVQVEIEYADMQHFARGTEELQKIYQEDAFAEWFNSWQDAVESGKREIYAVVA